MRHLVFASALIFVCALSAVALDKQNVVYAAPDGVPLYLDLHVPDGPGPFPAAILVHGGGFDGGSKSTNVRPLFAPLSDAGFAWFSIDCRLAPQAHFTQAIDDVFTAIKWVKANSAAYHVNPNRIALIGESAGGFLVNYAGTHLTSATQVAAVVDFYGHPITGRWPCCAANIRNNSTWLTSTGTLRMAAAFTSSDSTS